MGVRPLNLVLHPKVLRWARERSGLSHTTLAQKTGVTADCINIWESSGEINLTQAEKLAHITHTPLGYLFLDSPPLDSLPIQDFRTIGDRLPTQPEH